MAHEESLDGKNNSYEKGILCSPAYASKKTSLITLRSSEL